MLKKLTLNNYAFTEALTMEFQPGLNIITGATGSGKSLIVSAVETVFGSRRRPRARDSRQRMVVEAEFHAPHLDGFLRKADLEIFPELIIRREIRPGGGSRFFLNDTPVKLRLVSGIKESLVDFHGQHDLSKLLQVDYHTDFVDGFSPAREAAGHYSEVYRKWRELQNRREELTREREREKERAQLHAFQLREIREAQIRQNEDRQLLEQERFLANAEELRVLLYELKQWLYHADNSVYSRLQQSLKQAERLREMLPEASSVADLLLQSLPPVEEATHEVTALEDRVEHNPGLLDEVRRRLAELSELKRKYGPTLEEVLAREQELAAEEDRVRQVDVLLEELTEQEEELRRRREEAAQRLTSARKSVARELEKRVNPLLKELGINGTGLEVRLEPFARGLQERGAESCRFYISTNPGAPVVPLEQTASGGELSRVMLALKTVAAHDRTDQVLFFDEIDKGISGGAAEAVGKRLRKLAETHQVICITHLPQIAALADHHYSVRKETLENETRITIVPLVSGERVEEIARLAGGKKVTASQLRYASELINQNRR